MGTAQATSWFGWVLAWSTVPDGPHLRQAHYAGVEYVIERLGRLAADQHGVYPGWHLWRSTSTAEYPGQFGCYLAEDLALAKQLAETRIITACPTYSVLGQPPSLFTVLRGSPTSTLSVAGTTLPVVIVSVPDQPMIRVHRYDLVADPRMGTGGFLGEIRAEIHRSADVSTEPVTIDWTVHTADGRAVSTHSGWDAAYTDLVAVLASTRVPDKDVVCTVCGNRGNHLCREQWRLANGRIAKRPKAGSVRAVSGGLPGLGEHPR